MPSGEPGDESDGGDERQHHGSDMRPQILAGKGAAAVRDAK